MDVLAESWGFLGRSWLLLGRSRAALGTLLGRFCGIPGIPFGNLPAPSGCIWQVGFVWVFDEQVVDEPFGKTMRFCSVTFSTLADNVVALWAAPGTLLGHP